VSCLKVASQETGKEIFCADNKELIERKTLIASAFKRPSLKAVEFFIDFNLWFQQDRQVFLRWVA
jgi:hypothetical protein